MKILRQKFGLLVVSLVLLVAVGLYATSAWYTKMVSSSGVDFNIAKWDFTANHNVDSMNVNVYEYASINKGYAAPGTRGYIPIELTAEISDTDVDYYITVDKTTMSDEFQKRLYFYYNDTETDPNAWKNATVEENGSWKEFENEDKDLSGVISKGTSTKKVYLYWEWIYEYKDIKDSYKTNNAILEENSVKFDEFDTEVGKHPDEYAKYMNATVKIAGVEAKVVPSGT